MSRTLTQPDINTGLLVYVSAIGSITKFTARHIVSYTSLPDNRLSIVTTGGGQILRFNNPTDTATATAILDNALA